VGVAAGQMNPRLQRNQLRERWVEAAGLGKFARGIRHVTRVQLVRRQLRLDLGADGVPASGRLLLRLLVRGLAAAECEQGEGDG